MTHLLRLSALHALTGWLLLGPTGGGSPAPAPPEVSRWVVFRNMDDGARGEARFVTVVVSYPRVPSVGVAGAYVRLQVVLGRLPGPALPAHVANRVVLDLLVRRAGRQLRYWPELVSTALDGRMPCQAAETPLLDLGDTLHTARTGRYQTCYTQLETNLFAVTPPARHGGHALPLPGGDRGLVDQRAPGGRPRGGPAAALARRLVPADAGQPAARVSGRVVFLPRPGTPGARTPVTGPRGLPKNPSFQ